MALKVSKQKTRKKYIAWVIWCEMPKPAVTLAEKILPSIPNNGLDLQQLKISEIYNLNRENRGFFNFNFFFYPKCILRRSNIAVFHFFGI